MSDSLVSFIELRRLADDDAAAARSNIHASEDARVPFDHGRRPVLVRTSPASATSIVRVDSLYQLVAGHVEGFLSEAHEQYARRLPATHGACATPRRDHVFPEVPVQQRVLSVPYELATCAASRATVGSRAHRRGSQHGCQHQPRRAPSLLDSSADENSSLSGTALVALKVKELVDMGGAYPSGNEFNFYFQASAGTTKAVVDGWPTPVVFSGYEIGASAKNGAALKDTPENNPVRAGYAAWGGVGASQWNWDLSAVLYAARGASDYWNLESVGFNQVQDDGSNAWQTAPDKDHSYLKTKMAPADVAAVLEALLIQPPGG